MDPGFEQESFTLSFPARETSARDGIQHLAAVLRARGLSEDRAGDVEIALAEAINNVVEHAYEGRMPGQVRVTCCLGGDRLDILIADRGRGFPDGRIPRGESARIDLPVENLPEGGFGWHLIRQLTSDIRYERIDGLNRLSLTFDLPGEPSLSRR